MAQHPADAQAFIKHIPDGGYRPNRYRVTLSGELAGIDGSMLSAATESFSFMCVSSQVPASQMGVAEAHYFGRPIKLTGDKVFDDWTCEVYGTMAVRNFLELWHDRILGFETNLASDTYDNPVTYYMDATVDLMNRTGEILTTYKMRQIFPSSIGEIALSYENNNQIARFPVTFAVNYFTREDKDVDFKRLSNGAQNTGRNDFGGTFGGIFGGNR